MSRRAWWESGLIPLRYLKNLRRTFLRINPAIERRWDVYPQAPSPYQLRVIPEVLIPSHPWPVPLGPTIFHGQRMLSGRESGDTSFILNS